MDGFSEHDPFYAVVSLAAALKITDIMHLPGCWELQIDDRWWIALNGHKVPTPTSGEPHGEGGPDGVPPFSCYVEYNGWPAGILDYEGGEFAAGEGANPATFVAACKTRAEAVSS